MSASIIDSMLLMFCNFFEINTSLKAMLGIEQSPTEKDIALPPRSMLPQVQMIVGEFRKSYQKSAAVAAVEIVSTRIKKHRNIAIW